MSTLDEKLTRFICEKVLTKEDKFRLLNSVKINKEVYHYLGRILGNLQISVLGEYEGDIFELMKKGYLEGWCWQTTESAIVFFNDDDYIERGHLYVSEYTPEYYHSWICFKYKDKEYVFDPCLNLLCTKGAYSRIFETNVIARVHAKDVKEALIKMVTTPKVKNNSKADQEFDQMLKCLLGSAYDSFKEDKKDEYSAGSSEDIDSPFYRNGAGYKSEVENGQVKRLKVHYYETGF